MPLLSTLAGARGFGRAASSREPDSHWIALLGSTSSTDYSTSLDLDSAGNVYVAGVSNESVNGWQLAKYNKNGAIQWQKKLATNGSAQAIKLDSSGNIYVGGYSNANSVNNFHIAQYNNSGDIQWQRHIGSSVDNGLRSISLDADNNLYATGWSSPSNVGTNPFYHIQTVKYNSSGTLQWQRRLGGNGYTFGQGIAVNSAGDSFVAGDSLLGGTTGVLLKYNTNGTLQWQYSYGTGRFQSVKLDSSGNIYLCATSSGSWATVLKLDSSGNIIWVRSLVNAGSVRDLDVDSAGNVYCISGADPNLNISKYNSSGTLQWQRRFTSSIQESYRECQIRVDSDNFYITGRIISNSDADGFIAKLPADGTKTGNYVVDKYEFTYAATSFSQQEPGAGGPSSTSLTASTSTLTTGTTSMTASNSQLTSRFTDVVNTASLAKATGGTVLYGNGFMYHKFSTTGTFTPTTSFTGNSLVVAGGAGGGNNMGGGGGAGGYLTATQSFTPQNYSVTIGAGGAGTAQGSWVSGSPGNNTVFNGLTAIGGGSGGGAGLNGGNGGSGGGAGTEVNRVGGSGTAGQGNKGGDVPNNGSGGGGGAGAAGENGLGYHARGGNGGVGLQWLNGNFYAGGGGAGAGGSGTYVGGTGGNGGGGTGATTNQNNATAGAANTGGGGGGGPYGTNPSAAGGSGIVIIRYMA